MAFESGLADGESDYIQSDKSDPLLSPSLLYVFVCVFIGWIHMHVSFSLHFLSNSIFTFPLYFSVITCFGLYKN